MFYALSMLYAFECCCLLKRLTLLFFSTKKNINDHQFQVCDTVNSRRVPMKVECKVGEFVGLTSKALYLPRRGNNWWQCCDLLSPLVPYFSLRTPAEKVGGLRPPRRLPFAVALHVRGIHGGIQWATCWNTLSGLLS